jgi:hypothetical protein
MSMMKSERQELAQLVRRREKLAKAGAEHVARERLADFEKQAASYYRADDDEVWAEQKRLVAEVVKDAQIRIAERNRELGIPEWAAPGLSAGWYGRGENAVKERVAELRKVAQTRINADLAGAKAQIEMASVELQTRLIAGGLESEEAKAFLAAMPEPEALLPRHTVAEIEGGIAKPEVEDEDDI